jgi:hypothetical protein
MGRPKANGMELKYNDDDDDDDDDTVLKVSME